MARRKVTFVYDPEKMEAVAGLEAVWRAWSNSDSFSVTVEDLPDPPIVVEEFVVRITSPADLGGIEARKRSDLVHALRSAARSWLAPAREVEVEVPDA